jgi:hypothetical protein
VELKVGDGELKVGDEGTFRATIARYNTVDSDGDVTLAGAFTPGQAVRIAQWGHNWSALPVGEGTLGGDAGRAWVDGQLYLDTVAGREHYAVLKRAGPRQQWSYGFTVKRATRGEFQGHAVRFLHELHVIEASPVMAGAGGAAVSTEWVKAAWSSAYVGGLPDSAFAVVTSAGLRKLPHHDSSGALDLPHLRAALSRLPQTDLSAAEREKARRHLERHAAEAGVGDYGKDLDPTLVALRDHYETVMARHTGHELRELRGAYFETVLRHL